MLPGDFGTHKSILTSYLLDMCALQEGTCSAGQFNSNASIQFARTHRVKNDYFRMFMCSALAPVDSHVVYAVYMAQIAASKALVGPLNATAPRLDCPSPTHSRLLESRYLGEYGRG